MSDRPQRFSWLAPWRWLRRLSIVVAGLTGAAAVILLLAFFGLRHIGYFEDASGLRRGAESAFRFVVWDAPNVLPGELNTLYGNLEATWAGDTLIVSRWVSETDSDLFLSQYYPESGWSKPVALRFLNSGAEERTPFLLDDGKTLLFASTREGGRGGFDLYRTVRSAEGWSRPENLGTMVNSEDDELAPFFDSTANIFLFASDREGGAGGLDLYRLRAVWPEEAGLFWPPSEALPPENLAHLNSPADDRDPAWAPTGTVTFASDRDDGLGGFDLYRGGLEATGDAALPINLDAPINSAYDERATSVTAEGFALRYATNRASRTSGDFAFLEARSREVALRIDSALLRDLILALLLLTVAALLLQALLRLLMKADSALSLVSRCLLASFLIHLILAALSGTWMFSSRAGDAIRDSNAPMTINLNALAQESVALAVRESLQSLPAATPAPSTQRASLPLEAPTPATSAPAPLPAPQVVETRATPSFTPSESPGDTSGGSPSPALPKMDLASAMAPLSLQAPKIVLDGQTGAQRQTEGDDQGEVEAPRPAPQIVRRAPPPPRELPDTPPPSDSLPPVTTESLAELARSSQLPRPTEKTAVEPSKSLDQGRLTPDERPRLASAPLRQSLGESLGILPMPNLLRFQNPPDRKVEESPDLGWLTTDPLPIEAWVLAIQWRLRDLLQGVRPDLEVQVLPGQPGQQATAVALPVDPATDPGRVGDYLASRMDPLRIPTESELEVPERYLR